jgi:hypothetical protein
VGNRIFTIGGTARSETSPHEEFDVTPGEDESVDEAVARDLKARLGP